MKKSHLLGLFFAACAVAAAFLLESTPSHGYQVQSTTVCGTLEGSHTWTAAGSPYHVTCSLTIAQGASLVIEAGTVVKMEKNASPGSSAELNIVIEPGASVTANGTAENPVVFTSVADDEYGGDLDGNPSTGSRGEWGMIHVKRNDAEFLYGSLSLNHALVRFGGYHYPTVTGTNPLVRVEGYAHIESSTFEHGQSHGMQLYSAPFAPLSSVTNSVLQHFQYYGTGLDLQGIPAVLNNLTISDTFYGLSLRDLTMDLSGHAISGCGDTCLILSSVAGTVENNAISNAKTGISINGFDQLLTVQNNVLTGIQETGIIVAHDNAVLYGNQIDCVAGKNTGLGGYVRSDTGTVMISNNTVTNCRYAAQISGFPTRMPSFANNNFAGTYFPNVIGIGGQLLSGTWQDVDGYPVVVASSISVPNGVTVTIPAGTAVKMENEAALGYSYVLKVIIEPGGSLVANGTAQNPVVFTSVDDDEYGGDLDGNPSTGRRGQWGMIYVQRNDAEFLYGSLSLNHTLVRFGGYNWPTGTNPLIRVDGYAHIENSTFEHGQSHGMQLYSAPFAPLSSVTNSVLQHFQYYGTGLDLQGTPVVLSNLTISDTFYGMSMGSVVMDLSGLTIRDCDTCLILNSVEGAVEDNSIANAKTGISISGYDELLTVQNNVLTGVQKTGIFVAHDNAVLHGNLIDCVAGKNTGLGGYVRSDTGTVMISNDTVTNCRYPAQITGFPTRLPSFANNNFAGTYFPNVIGIGGQLLSGTWQDVDGYPVVVASSISVPNGVTVTIPAGTAIKMEKYSSLISSAEMRVTIEPGGALVSNGTAENPVVFTSVADDEFGGDLDGNPSTGSRGQWGMIHVQRNDAASLYGQLRLNHTLVRFGGYKWWTGTNPLIQVDGYALVENSMLEHGYGNGIDVTTIGAIPPSEIKHTTVRYNSIGINVYGLAPLLMRNNLYGNSSYGLWSSGETVGAANHWWGDPSGPYHATQNLSGLGNAVSDHVVFNPWLPAPGGFSDDPPRLVATPSEVAADGSSTSVITLSNAPPGHRVRLSSSRGSMDTFTPPSGTTNAAGVFEATVRSSSPGTAIIVAKDLDTREVFATSTKVTFTVLGGGTQPPPGNYSPVAIIGVRANYPLDGRYLENIALPNRIDVMVDWKGSIPAHVDVILNETTHSLPTTASRVSYSLDMGQDLRAGTNTLRIVAVNAGGDQSLAQVFVPYLVPAPAWLAGLQAVGAIAPMLFGDSIGGGYEYQSTAEIPPGGIDLGAPSFGPPGSTTDIRFFVGSEFALPLICNSPAKIAGIAGVDLNIDLLGVELGGEVKGSGSLEGRAIQCEIPSLAGDLRLDIKVYGQKNWPVSVFVVNFIAPGVGEIFQAALPYDVLTILGEVYLQGNLRGFFSSGVHTIPEAPYLEWSGVTLGGGPGVETGYQFNKLGVKLKLFLGANGTAAFNSPDPLGDLTDLNFDELVIRGEAGYELKVFAWKQGTTYFVEWRYPPAELVSEPVLETGNGGWSLIQHIDDPGFAQFTSISHADQPFAATNVLTLGASNTITSVLVSNVYTYTEPSLSTNSLDQALLLWVHDDVDKPVGQSHEINFSRWDGTSWSTPDGVTDDFKLDGAPQVSWVNGNQAVAVWQRLGDTLPITATWNITTANKIEIATSLYDAGAGTWSPVALLTSNSSLDMTPSLAANANGNLLAVWRQNDHGLLSGDAAHPDRIITAGFDTFWSTPSTAVDNIPGLVDLAAGYGDGTATIAFTQFITPTGSLTPTLQLFTSTWNGADWSPPVQLTTDTLNHTSPQVTYNLTNQPLLTWLAGGELRLRNLATSSEAALTLPATIGDVDEFRVVQDQAGDIAAVFSAQASHRDLYASFFDQTCGLWGLPTALTEDIRSESYPAPALDTSGRLLMGYATTEIVPVTRTTTISGTGQVVTYTLPTEGQTDLMTLSHVFTRNLTLTDGDLALSDEHPGPGATVAVSATLANTGDLALSGVAAALYDGDPQGGGALIGTAAWPQPLAAGFTATLTLSYTVPTTGGPREIYVVADPQDQLEESDETDNQASLAAFGPDLALLELAVNQWGGSDVGLVSRVQNIGTTASPTSTLVYHWETITCTLAITDTLPPLEAGAAYTLTTPWNYGGLAEGNYPLAVVVNHDAVDFAEVYLENNQAPLMLRVGPDLMVSPYYVWLTPGVTSTVAITAAIYNVGSTPSPQATVDVFHGDPTDPGNLILSWTVPELAPANVVYLTGTWSGAPGGAQSVTVWIDPTQTITETTRTNNLASAEVDVPSIQQVDLTLGTGWNLLTMPLLPASPYTAQSMLDAVAANGGACSEIDRWLNGGWDAHINNLPFNDFVIEPGKGYFLKCTVTSQWTLEGFALASPVPLALQSGWNLIGVPHSQTGYTAQTLLDGIATQGGACSEVDRWLNGGWDAHINNLPFNDFAIEPNKGYFIKCSQASTFVPS